MLLAVPEAALSHNECRSRSAVQSILCVAPRCPRRSLVPFKSDEHQFCGALLTERNVCAGWSVQQMNQYKQNGEALLVTDPHSTQSSSLENTLAHSLKKSSSILIALVERNFFYIMNSFD